MPAARPTEDLDQVADATSPERREDVALHDNALLPRVPIGAAHNDPFHLVPAPQAPPPVVAIPAVSASPLPQAPAFPYTFLGHVIGPEGKPVVYLEKNQRLISVAGAGKLDESYRIEEFGERSMTIVHVATDQRIRIEYGSVPGKGIVR